MQTMQQIPELAPGQVRNSLTEQQIRTGQVFSKEAVLAYEFPDLVDRIQKEMRLPADKAHALFKDMLRFIHICGTHQSKRHPFYPPLRIERLDRLRGDRGRPVILRDSHGVLNSFGEVGRLMASLVRQFSNSI
jgi:hypothetical protein